MSTSSSVFTDNKKSDIFMRAIKLASGPSKKTDITQSANIYW